MFNWDEAEINEYLGLHGWHIEDINMLVDADAFTVESEEDKAIAAEREGVVYKAIAALPPKSSKILMLRFGLFGRDFTQAEVADIMGLTRSRIAQIEGAAMQILRKQLGAIL